MRIIGGEFSRLRFEPPKGLKLRPTTDIAKEALFSALSSLRDLEDLRILDLFSGTGSIGLEFISRGAREVVFIEKQPRHVRFIREIIGRLGVESRCRLMTGDALKLLSSPKISPPFDVIFADPPYDLPGIDAIPEEVLSADILTPGGIFVLEHPSSVIFEGTHPNCFKHKEYSAVNFSFFRD